MSTSDFLTDGQIDGMHELKAAVLNRACRDYILYKYRTPKSAKQRKLLGDLTKWFRSTVFEFWSGGVSGPTVMKKLDENYKLYGRMSKEEDQ